MNHATNPQNKNISLKWGAKKAYKMSCPQMTWSQKSFWPGCEMAPRPPAILKYSNLQRWLGIWFCLTSRNRNIILLFLSISQSWALVLFFPGSLSVLRSIFIHRSLLLITHFADFQVRSSSIALKKTSGLLLEKSAKTLSLS